MLLDQTQECCYITEWLVSELAALKSVLVHMKSQLDYNVNASQTVIKSTLQMHFCHALLPSRSKK